MNKNYVWVNPVVMVQYDIEYLKYILSKSGFEIVLPNKNCSDIVKNKYRKKYLNSDKCIIDSRCPKIYEYIDNNDNSYEYANINPILIETAIELKAQIENNIIIITPCVALSNFGNSLNLEGLIFKTWIEFVKENNIEIFIDDSCRNCKDIAYNSNAKVFIMDTRVNQNLEDEKITRVYSWPHLYKEIKKLKEEN